MLTASFDLLVPGRPLWSRCRDRVWVGDASEERSICVMRVAGSGRGVNCDQGPTKLEPPTKSSAGSTVTHKGAGPGLPAATGLSCQKWARLGCSQPPRQALEELKVGAICWPDCPRWQPTPILKGRPGGAPHIHPALQMDTQCSSNSFPLGVWWWWWAGKGLICSRRCLMN